MTSSLVINKEKKSLLGNRFVVLFLLLLGFLWWTKPVYGQGKVIMDLSSKNVPIKWDFQGANVLLFGAIDDNDHKGPSDIIVVISGPPRDITVRKKNRIAGIWINSEPKKFSQVPYFYFVASSKPLQEITSVEMLDLLGMGIKSIANKIVHMSETGADDTSRKDYASGIVRLLEDQNLYSPMSANIEILEKQLFRVSVELPANVPPGTFKADVYLFQDRKVVGYYTAPLSIQKSGVERMIYSMAYDYPFLYGVVAVILAIISGLVATAIFKKE